MAQANRPTTSATSKDHPKSNPPKKMPTLTQKHPATQNWINGQTAQSNSALIEVESPLNGELLTTIPQSGLEELNDAVNAAKAAFETWSQTPIKERAQIFYNYKTLLEENLEELAAIVHEENGKTMDEARAEVEKSIELTEFACSMPQLVAGQTMEVSKGVYCQTQRDPLGVVASIIPFNFPNMVPHWTIPNALVLGNTMIAKPSELVPLSCVKIGELLKKAGLPDGVLNFVNGGKTIVEAICDHPEIKAVSFVGSTPVAKIVYSRAASNLKRALALGGAKNHLLVLPDAHVQMTASNVVASMSGCAGQRCMAASVMVAVGDVDAIIDQMCEEARKIVAGENLGSVITADAKARIESFIDQAEKDGAKILLDGRNAYVPGKEGGYYVGPTIIDHVTAEMSVANEEIFGPVISIVRVPTLDQALEIEAASPFGNAAAVFTQNGGLATKFAQKAGAGMVGINIGVPVPREPFSFAGWNDSKFGVGDITGASSIEFWTQLKKVTTKWNAAAKVNWMS